jgi:hypothetical protein
MPQVFSSIQVWQIIKPHLHFQQKVTSAWQQGQRYDWGFRFARLGRFVEGLFFGRFVLGIIYAGPIFYRSFSIKFCLANDVQTITLKSLE